MAENLSQNNSRDIITGRNYLLVAFWTAAIILLYTVIGYFETRQLKSYKSQTEHARLQWMKTSATKHDINVSNLTSLTETKPVDVNVGIFIHRIGEFSLKDNRWTADFDIWFDWKGDDVHPGENFDVVDAQVELREKKISYQHQGQRYECYHVRAKILKYFDASRFPFGDEGLIIQIQDKVDDAVKLCYVADKQDVNISPQAIRKVLKITLSGTWIKFQDYPAIKKIYSRFIFAMLVVPPGLEIYIKMFQALFASVSIAFIVLFIKPIHVDPRFGLCVGAFFAVIGNNIYLQSYLPMTDSASLVDMVNGISLGTIFLILVQSAVSLYIFDTRGHEKLSRFFDKTSFVVLLLGYTVINVFLPLVAKS